MLRRNYVHRDRKKPLRMYARSMRHLFSEFKIFSNLTIACSDFFFFQAEDGIRDVAVTGVQTCALPISQAQRMALEAVVGPLDAGALAHVLVAAGGVMARVARVRVHVQAILVGVVVDTDRKSVV